MGISLGDLKTQTLEKIGLGSSDNEMHAAAEEDANT